MADRNGVIKILNINYNKHKYIWNYKSNFEYPTKKNYNQDIKHYNFREI